MCNGLLLFARKSTVVWLYFKLTKSALDSIEGKLIFFLLTLLEPGARANQGVIRAMVAHVEDSFIQQVSLAEHSISQFLVFT